MRSSVVSFPRHLTTAAFFHLTVVSAKLVFNMAVVPRLLEFMDQQKYFQKFGEWTRLPIHFAKLSEINHCIIIFFFIRGQSQEERESFKWNKWSFLKKHSTVLIFLISPQCIWEPLFYGTQGNSCPMKLFCLHTKSEVVNFLKMPSLEKRFLILFLINVV